MTFPIVIVSPDASTQLEQLGTKAKFWYQFDENQKALFKAGRPGTGENWAEKVCCELARLLGLPHAEQDRHHENWGLISMSEHGLVLAPTFDHASSLGRNETDENRRKRLNTKDKGFSVESYVEKARSGFFENKSSTKAMSTVDAFRECAKANVRAGQYWLDRLFALNDSDFSDILSAIPDDFISPEAREFASAMLSINRKRLLSLNGK